MKTFKLSNNIKSAAALALAVALALFAFAFRGVWQGAGPAERGPASREGQGVMRHPLTGEWLSKEIDNPRVYGVMIENMVDARPQIGLNDAFLVIEAPVEAAIPRFLAFFSDDQMVEKIGPVRSARPYFIDWNAEFDAAFAHVGGSPEALSRLKSDDTLDLDEVSNEWFFWRENGSRIPPHNVYTSIEKLRAGVERFESRFGEQEISYASRLFSDESLVSDEPIKEVRVIFRNPVDYRIWGDTYSVVWKYDEETNTYLRFHGDEPHILEDGSQVRADNVAVMATDIEVMDSVGRRKVRTIGEGEAVVFRDGGRAGNSWKKESRSSPLTFVELDGSPVAFRPGSTWIEVLPSYDFLRATADEPQE